MRKRDSQRSKVYRAERQLEAQPCLTQEETRAYVTKVVRSRWFRHRHRTNAVHLKWHRGTRSWANPYRSTIDFGSRVTPRLVLHELAHLLAPLNTRHGAEFCRIYLQLVKKFLGPSAASELRRAFVQHGVRHRKPKQYSPVVLERMRQRGRALVSHLKENHS